jgi:hypothetical protein
MHDALGEDFSRRQADREPRLKLIAPLRGRSMPLTVASKVDFPAPLGPTMHMISPRRTAKDTPLSTSPPP